MTKIFDIKDDPTALNIHSLHKLSCGDALIHGNRIAILAYYGSQYSPSSEMFLLLENGRKRTVFLSFANVFGWLKTGNPSILKESGEKGLKVTQTSAFLPNGLKFSFLKANPHYFFLVDGMPISWFDFQVSHLKYFCDLLDPWSSVCEITLSHPSQETAPIPRDFQGNAYQRLAEHCKLNPPEPRLVVDFTSPFSEYSDAQEIVERMKMIQERVSTYEKETGLTVPKAHEFCKR